MPSHQSARGALAIGAPTPNIEIRVASFGDGYSQPTPDYPSHLRKSVQMKRSALLCEQVRAIDAFFYRAERHAAIGFTTYVATPNLKCTSTEFGGPKDDGISYPPTLAWTLTLEA